MKSLKQLLSVKGNQVYFVHPEARVIEALQSMAQKDVGALLVMDGGRIAGIISERDYARKVILHGRSSQDITVREIMTSGVVTVELSSTIDECMALMTQRRIRHLPVCDGNQLAGLVSIGDLVKEVIAEQEQTIRQLESYIHS